MNTNANLSSRGDRIYNFSIYAILTLLMLMILYPLLYVLSSSFSNPMSIVKGEVWLWPVDFTINAYTKVFQNPDIMIGYRNSIIYLVVGTTVNIVMTTMGAYTLSRSDLKGRHFLTMMFTFTLLFHGGLIPTYLVYKNVLGLYNNIWAMVIPGAISVWNMIIMRTYFQTSIPSELHEAAFIDGASNIKVLTSVVLPLSKPIIAVMVMYYGVAHWNSYFTALIYLNDHWRMPLQMVIREILIQGDTKAMAGGDGESLVDQLMLVEGLRYSVIVVSSIPMLILYPLVQKHFVKGVMMGALKG